MVRRIARINKITKLKDIYPNEFQGIDIDSVEFYIDVTDDNEKILMFNLISENKHKFMFIVREILQAKYNNDLYRKEDGNITAMKFKTSKQNARIYCLEISGASGSKKKVIMSRILPHKSSQKNDNKIKPIITSIKTYVYEYE